MIGTTKEILSLFEELSKEITRPISIYLIGGAAMMFFERKDQTKDIDIVLATSKEYEETINTLEKNKFTGQLPTKEYAPFDLSQIYVREDFRIDVFEKTVCKGFSLTTSMQNRAIKIFENNNLKVFSCSPTDIFLFKTFTERDGDLDDCLSLAKEGIEWSEMLAEIQIQIRHAKQPVWITYIGERLDILKETLEIPIMNEIDKLRDEYFNNLEQELEKKNE